MKTIFTFFTLPVIILICFLSGKFYISGDYVASYSLVLTWFLSLILWINHVSLQLQQTAQVNTVPQSGNVPDWAEANVIAFDL